MAYTAFAPTSTSVVSDFDVLDLFGYADPLSDAIGYADDTETFYPFGSTADSFDAYSTFDADDYEFAQSRFF